MSRNHKKNRRVAGKRGIEKGGVGNDGRNQAPSGYQELSPGLPHTDTGVSGRSELANAVSEKSCNTTEIPVHEKNLKQDREAFFPLQMQLGDVSEADLVDSGSSHTSLSHSIQDSSEGEPSLLELQDRYDADVNSSDESQRIGGEQLDEIVACEGVVTHFWVCTYPYFDCSLFVMPPLFSGESVAKVGSSSLNRGSSAVPSAAISSITVYDPDGQIINSVRFSTKDNSVGLIELGPLFGACKMQSGMKFGQVVVRSPKGFSHRLRMMNTVCGVVLSEGKRIICSEKLSGLQRPGGTHGAAGSLSGIGLVNFPINLGKGRQSLVTLINRGAEDAVVRCRLALGKRSPEVDCRIPAYGARVLHLESVFSLLVSIPTEKTVQSYLRLSIKQGEAVGAQIIERNFAQGESEYFVAVA
jgi:hypothetical protein